MNKFFSSAASIYNGMRVADYGVVMGGKTAYLSWLVGLNKPRKKKRIYIHSKM